MPKLRAFLQRVFATKKQKTRSDISGPVPGSFSHLNSSAPFMANTVRFLVNKDICPIVSGDYQENPIQTDESPIDTKIQNQKKSNWFRQLFHILSN